MSISLCKCTRDENTLTENVDRDGLYFKISLTDDFGAAFIYAAVAWLDVVNS